jgi:hypothetical protein
MHRSVIPSERSEPRDPHFGGTCGSLDSALRAALGMTRGRSLRAALGMTRGRALRAALGMTRETARA